MRLEITGHQMEVAPDLRRLVERKLARVLRVLNDAAVSATVVLSLERPRHLCEITLHARGERFMHALGRGETWPGSLTLASDQLMHQVEKVKGKWQDRQRRGEAARSVKKPRALRQSAPETRAAAKNADGRAKPTSAGRKGRVRKRSDES